MRGTGVALVTPFNKELKVDFQGLQKLLEHVTHGRVDYLVVHGTTGEAATTTPEEKRAILSFIQDHNTKKLPIVYGIGGNSTNEVINTIKNISFEGIDAVLATSPHYNKPSQKGIYQHYKAIAERCPVPILLYNIPARTGINITAATTLQLSKHSNIIGIKEASGDLLQCMEIARAKHEDFLVISGEDILTLPMIAAGAVGVISAIANAFPKTIHHLTELALQSNDNVARAYTWELLPIARLLSQAGNPVGTKQLLTILDICQNYVRLPLVTVPPPLARKMKIATLQKSTK